VSRAIGNSDEITERKKKAEEKLKKAKQKLKTGQDYGDVKGISNEFLEAKREAVEIYDTIDKLDSTRSYSSAFRNKLEEFKRALEDEKINEKDKIVEVYPLFNEAKEHLKSHIVIFKDKKGLSKQLKKDLEEYNKALEKLREYSGNQFADLLGVSELGNEADIISEWLEDNDKGVKGIFEDLKISPTQENKLNSSQSQEPNEIDSSSIEEEIPDFTNDEGAIYDEDGNILSVDDGDYSSSDEPKEKPEEYSWMDTRRVVTYGDLIDRLDDVIDRLDSIIDRLDEMIEENKNQVKEDKKESMSMSMRY
jgi:hypothetical protein